MDPIFQTLANYGLPGFGLLALGYAYVRKDNKLDECNEKRIAEARETIKAIDQNTNSLEILAELLRDRKQGR